MRVFFRREMGIYIADRGTQGSKPSSDTGSHLEYKHILIFKGGVFRCVFMQCIGELICAIRVFSRFVFLRRIFVFYMVYTRAVFV